ncbi:MAG: chaperonin GroES [Candidatus Omnitrophota bacterium]|jgi:chaperonin GroES
MKLKPLADRVVVQPLEAEEKTSSGIFIPDSAQEKQQKGKIIAVGQGRINDEGKIQALEVKVSDEVLYGRYSGTEIKVDGSDYLIIKEEDILAIVG